MLTGCLAEYQGTCPATAPVLTTTSAVIGSSYTTATTGGTITSDGGAAITARGVCWSTSSGPTIADNKTSNGTGIGSFTSSMTGLTIGTTYYIRAYATNSAGTTYGNEIVLANTDIAIVNNFNLSFDGTINIVNINWTSTAETSLVSYTVNRLGVTSPIVTVGQRGPSIYPLVQDYAGPAGSGTFTYNLIAVYNDGTKAIVATKSITI